MALTDKSQLACLEAQITLFSSSVAVRVLSISTCSINDVQKRLIRTDQNL